ncbi:unnamed protein product, partial [Mesorhabditis belari]|uniref:Uncharacterized protein n=1 Tax=Mesorhabditis belari TaxID=2138241 RepID=A0AAF3EPI3_9BILA
MGIDRIINIETAPTQLIIYTTKEGPSDQLTIKIETNPRNDQNSTNEFVDPKFEIYVHRNDESGSKNTEGVFVTAKWLSEKRIEGSSLLIHVFVKCEHTSADEIVVLKDSATGITIEIAMDHRLEIEDLDGNHQIKANIMPLKCREICWDVTYLMNVLGRNFSRSFNQTCDQIKGTTATTFVRQLQSYEMIDHQLFVNTKVHSESESDEEKVKLIAKNLISTSSEPLIQEYR